MLRSRRHMVKKLNPFGLGVICALSLLLGAGCYLFRYEAVMETHLTLMEQYSTKLQYMADNGLQVSGPDWVEFEYPGQRAVEFVRIVRPSFGDTESLAAFERSLELYLLLVASPEILRGSDPVSIVTAGRSNLLEAIRVNREVLTRAG
jgi:hypothetical protein